MRVLFLTGPMRAGKSSIARAISHKYADHSVIDIDEIAMNIAPNTLSDDKDRSGLINDYIKNIFAANIKNDVHTIIPHHCLPGVSAATVRMPWPDVIERYAEKLPVDELIDLLHYDEADYFIYNITTEPERLHERNNGYYPDFVIKRCIESSAYFSTKRGCAVPLGNETPDEAADMIMSLLHGGKGRIIRQALSGARSK
ncbi:MAG: hypothetical protein HZC28_18640 [Spirochaetes bacterium]|nr:hypothetical protein [Spirochaetota bacterium]